MRYPVQPLTLKQLQKRATPQPVAGGQSEANAWIFYDTKTYISGTTTTLTFFDQTGDPSITNMTAAGQLTDPNYAQIYYFGADALQPVTALDVATPAGAWDNTEMLFRSGLGHWTFEMSDKKWGDFPNTALHSSGGVQGFGYAQGASTNVLSKEYANNSVPDGGFCQDGAITIPPKVNFFTRMVWPTPIVLAGGTNVQIRMFMYVVLHRRVL